jgi:hypothetical protein
LQNTADETNEAISDALGDLCEYERQDQLAYQALRTGAEDLRKLITGGAERSVIAEKLCELCDIEYNLLLDCEVFGGIAERLGYDDDLAVIQERELSRRKDDDGRTERA